jgi:hypothetical protein
MRRVAAAELTAVRGITAAVAAAAKVMIVRLRLRRNSQRSHAQRADRRQSNQHFP